MIDTQGYLEQVIVYIHLNPVRAGLTEDPIDYPFCGHRELMKKAADPLTDVDHALLGFGGSLKEARRQYRARIRAGMDQEEPGTWEGLFGLLGPRDRNLQPVGPAPVDMLGRSAGRERPPVDAAKFLERSCSILGVEADAPASSRRDRETAGLRRLIASVGVERWGQTAGRLAVLLRKHPVAVSRWVSDAARRRQEDPAFAEKIEALDEALTMWAAEASAVGNLANDIAIDG